jgi:predicted nucleic-acid-binding protein
VRAVDTNIIARALMRDDAHQARIADEVLATEAFVPLTVLLETAWLLRSRYGLSRMEVVIALRSLLDMPKVLVDCREQVEWALARLLERGDFADLIHLVAARGATAFLTFDSAVAADAGDDAPCPIETLT